MVASQGIDAGTRSPAWGSVVERGAELRSRQLLDVEQYRVPSPTTVPLLPQARAYAAPSFSPGRPWLEALLKLTCRIRRVPLRPCKATTVDTGVFRCWTRSAASAGTMRALMLSSCAASASPRAAWRHVFEPAAGRWRGSRADASHAWVAACPGLGWVAFLGPPAASWPTRNSVTLGWGRSFSMSPPLRGVVIKARPHASFPWP